MQNILLANNEKQYPCSFLKELHADRDKFNLLKAENGKEGVSLLKSNKIDLVITNIEMPVMDGFDFIFYIASNHPHIPVIAMTSTDIPSNVSATIDHKQVLAVLRRPVSYKTVIGYFDREEGGKPNSLNNALAENNASGGKPSADNAGNHDITSPPALFFDDDESLFKNILPDILTFTPSTPKTKNLKKGNNPEEGRYSSRGKTEFKSTNNLLMKEEKKMAIQDKLKEFASLDGFDGVALYTPAGEPIAVLEAQGSQHNLKTTGVRANNILVNTQKIAGEMGLGVVGFVHVEAENAHIIVECLNEGTSLLKAEPGKAHIHLVLILKSDAGIGFAKLKASSIIQSLAPELRV